uniref:DUF7804 domain-containing protein n=1 Tax=Lactuca sativa TaxID=4236 RepID=A0A9R1UIS1_LACSA|nr:hypothetical protein LSAT_V11C900481100 [Lactuca sativa]
MACLGIRHSGVGDCMILKRGGGYTDERSNRLSGFTQLSIPNLAVKIPNHRVSTAVYATLACDSGHRSTLSLFDDGLDLRTEPFGGGDDNEDHDRTCIESPRASEKLDEWMRISVTEIVKNIKQAPLLVQIYADGEVEMKKSPAAKDWRNVVKHRSSSLEGVILVEELQENADQVDSDVKLEEEDGTKAFGVLIQGKIKGIDQCKSTCYLLKTSSVNGGGMGHFCTHFCLMKVQSFHENAFSQFSNCWLLR